MQNKKVNWWFAVTILSLFMGTLAYAVTQYNWGTSTGQAWQTPSDTSVTPNQFLVIGSTTGATPTILAVSQPALQSQTIAQINLSTPSAVGQLVFCSNCVLSPICIGTETVNVNAWVAVMSTSTAAPGQPFTKCL